MSFAGFGEDAFDFFAGLEADNSKAYWSDHSETYRMAVREPMEALLAVLEPEFGPGSMFRPYRDVRFSKDKSPYKTHAGALAGKRGSGGLYMHVSVGGLYVAAGYYQLAADQLDRFRRAVDDDIAGGGLERLVSVLTEQGYAIGGEQVRTRPRGWPADHPRLDLLRRKSLYAGRQWEPAEWMHRPECAEQVATAWRDVAPLTDWLHTHVGPSAEPGRR